MFRLNKPRLCGRLGGMLAALLCLASLAHAGDYERGMQALETGDVATALALWRPMAEAGSPQAQFALGALYNDALGVAQDYAEANYWFLRAAEQGYAMAQFNLGNAYREGTGLAVDPVMAVIWWRKAAEQGFSPAQFNLGSAYLEGFGTPRDKAAAISWYQRASANGHAQAALNLEELQGESPVTDGGSARAPVEQARQTAPAPVPAKPAAPPAADTRPDASSTAHADQRSETARPAAPAPVAPAQPAQQDRPQSIARNPASPTPPAAPQRPAFDRRTQSAACADLLEQQTHTHTVQLMVSQSASRLSAYIAEHKLSQTAICNYHVEGKHWHVLLYGRYASADAARAALEKLPDAVRVNGGYVRRISVITRAVSKTP